MYFLYVISHNGGPGEKALTSIQAKAKIEVMFSKFANNIYVIDYSYMERVKLILQRQF